MEEFKKIGKFAIPAAVAVMPFLALAALPVFSNPVGGTGISLAEVEAIINQIARFMIVISLVVAVIFIIYGGLRYMTAGGDPARVKAATETIKNGVIGALVVLAVGVILQTLAGLVSRTFFS